VDFNKVYAVTIEKVQKMPIINKTVKAVIFVKDVGKWAVLVTSYKIISIMEKHKDSKLNKDAKEYYSKLSKQIEEKLSNPKHQYIKIATSRFLDRLRSSRILYSNSIKKMNNFIKSNWLEKKFYFYKEYLTTFLGSKKFSINNIFYIFERSVKIMINA